MDFEDSIYRPVSTEDVREEYREAAKHPDDARRAKWGSRASMLNRFHLAVDVIDWEAVQRWVDVGCGVGEFFRVARKRGVHVPDRWGVDITPELLEMARERISQEGVEFLAADMSELPSSIVDVDVLTAIGVLQQCGTKPDEALREPVARIESGGQIFLTTKNITWSKFVEGELEPEENHSWFHPDEIRRTLEDIGIKIEAEGGVLPREGKRVPFEGSHTMYFHGRRQT